MHDGVFKYQNKAVLKAFLFNKSIFMTVMIQICQSVLVLFLRLHNAITVTCLEYRHREEIQYQTGLCYWLKSTAGGTETLGPVAYIG